ncbi:hypothetical protein V2J23_17335 [Geobacillus thermoleovorans]|uniref:hypothetical protein n=1 Tax=Geobacillus thermoleovorans TaxID=33941 RepID=UPI00345BCC8F
MKISKKFVFLLVFSLCISTSLEGEYAFAEDNSTSGEDIGSLVDNITDAQDIVDPTVLEQGNVAVVQNEAGTIQIPLDSNVITVNDEDIEKNELKITLPKLNSEDAVKTENGTIVYHSANEPSDLAVQPTTEGIRSLIVIKDASAPHEYRFTIDVPDGEKLVSAAEYLGEEFDTGEVFIVDSDNKIQSVFAPAWAKDANGNPVPTHFIIKGNDIIQVVDFNENTAFPIVADPNWMKIAKCSAALAGFVGFNLFAAAKVIKIKRYIKELGGVAEAAKLLVEATTWEEKLRVGGQALVGLAGELTGITGVYEACFK